MQVKVVLALVGLVLVTCLPPAVSRTVAQLAFALLAIVAIFLRRACGRAPSAAKRAQLQRMLTPASVTTRSNGSQSAGGASTAAAPSSPVSRSRSHSQVAREALAHHVVGHRGNSRGAPENTLPAIHAAAAQGASAVEVDVQFTKDGVPVLMHDTDTRRTTGIRGCIGDMTLREVKELDAAVGFAAKTGNKSFTGTKVPTLQEAIELCKELDLMIYLDVNFRATREQVTSMCHQVFSGKPSAFERVLVCSFNPILVWRAARVDPRIHVVLTRRRYFFSRLVKIGIVRPTPFAFVNSILGMLADQLLDWCTLEFLWHACGISILLTEKDLLCTYYVQKWARRGVHIMAWTVNDVHEKRFCRDVLHVPIMTDCPGNH